MLRRRGCIYGFLRIFMVAAMLLCSLAVPATAPAGYAAVPQQITLTWTSDPATTQTITWKADSAMLQERVQYVEGTLDMLFPASAKTVEAIEETLYTNEGEVNIYSATLQGLKPGTCYNYRVGGENGWSDIHNFSTSAANVTEFKFLVFGDSQSVHYDTWRNTLLKAYAANRDAAFFINAGDLVDVGQDYNQWTAWFQAASGVIDTIPVMPITGNHETYTPERKFSLPVFFTAQFKVPQNGPVGLTGQVYSFDYGNVHFAMLDSQAGEEKEFISEAMELQKKWLMNDLASSDKKWKVVFMHRPPYSNRPGRENPNIRDAFVPIFDQYHVDVVFTAHDHTYARTYPLCGGAVVESPSQGTIYVATGRSGSKRYFDLAPKAADAFFYDPQDEPNYLTVEINDEILTVRAFTQNGMLMDEWKIDKMDDAVHP